MCTPFITYSPFCLITNVFGIIVCDRIERNVNVWNINYSRLCCVGYLYGLFRKNHIYTGIYTGKAYTNTVPLYCNIYCWSTRRDSNIYWSCTKIQGYNTGLNIFDIKIFNLITNGKSKINSDTQENMRVNKTIVKFQIFIHPCSSEDWYVVSSSASITKRTTFWKLSIFLFIWVFKWPTAMYAFNHGAR